MIKVPLVKIAKRGRSVDSSDVNDFLFHSEEVLLKTRLDADPAHIGVKPYRFDSEPSVGLTQLLSFDHEYPYSPGLLSYFSFDGKVFYRIPFRYDFDSSSGSYQNFLMYSDQKKVFFSLNREGSVWTPLSGKTVYFKLNVLDVIGMV